MADIIKATITLNTIRLAELSTEEEVKKVLKHEIYALERVVLDKWRAMRKGGKTDG